MRFFLSGIPFLTALVRLEVDELNDEDGSIFQRRTEASSCRRSCSWGAISGFKNVPEPFAGAEEGFVI